MQYCAHTDVFLLHSVDEDLPLIHVEPFDCVERKQNIEPCLFVLHDEGVNLTGVDINGKITIAFIYFSIFTLVKNIILL